MKKLVNYVYSNLLGTSNEKLTVYKKEDGSFSHTRENGWLDEGQEIISLNFGDESPKNKRELKNIIVYRFATMY